MEPPPRSAFTIKEQRIVASLRTPRQVQRWLKSLPYNFETEGETLRTFRGVIRTGEAHCLEGALSAAVILEQHGYPPLLVDFESVDYLDHVLFLYRAEGRYDTIARSRDPGLHGRKPVFRTVRDLVYSYVDPYVDRTGRIKGYGILRLGTLRVDWRLSSRNVWAVEQALLDMPHRPLSTSNRRYDYWHGRYLRYKKRYPKLRPAYYPNRHQWL